VWLPSKSFASAENGKRKRKGSHREENLKLFVITSDYGANAIEFLSSIAEF
jgi:hypothetical protein